jgi:hypothetical protein
MFVTWRPKTKTLHVHFRTRISDGAYKIIEGGGRIGPPVRKGLRPPPPPRPFKIRTGTEFGVEFGLGYEVSHKGNLLGTRVLPFESFRKEIKAPVVGRLPPRR